MFVLPRELVSKLYGFQQRKLTDGEIVLLAKAFSDSLQLPPAEVENMNQYVISSKPFINKVLDLLYKHIYLSEEDEADMYNHIVGFMFWRSNIAYKPSRVIFSGDTNNLVDDMSGLLRYVNCATIATIGDKMNDANWTYGLFADIVECVKRG